MSEARTNIQHGCKWPYDERPAGDDPARIAALGILSDLCDRRGIKQELQRVDDDVSEGEDMETRREIVDAMAAIIREAYSTTPAAAREEGA